MKRLFSFVLVATLVLALVPGVAVGAPAAALRARDFSKTADKGFGDPQNAYAWAMAEFNGDVYVGTARLANLNSIMPMISSLIGFEMPDVPGQPPSMLDWLDATATAGPTVTDPAKYAEWNALAHAEIWRNHAGTWSRVWVAPDVPSFLRAPDGTHPYMTAEITGLRSMQVFTDKNGVTALYATAGGTAFGAPGYNPKIIRSLDGQIWQALSTPAGMGSETRATAVHSGRLYAGANIGAALGYAGLGTGVGSMWSSDDPADPASWKKVLDFADADKTNSSVSSIASFNGHVYAGTENMNGFQVWRSKNSNPTTTTDFVKVMGDGGGDRYNFWASTMKGFGTNLYVGSIGIPGLPNRTGLKGFDVFRIGTNDKPRMLIGNIKPAMPVTKGALRTAPLSGWPSGFGNPLNMYLWSFEVYNGRLYLGSLDQTGMFAQIPKMMGAPSWLTNLNLGGRIAGADLWQTGDGVVWAPVSLNGLGDSTNYGFRTMRATSNGLVIGTANPFAGCQVWRGKR
jgi:hypothetical protein